MKPLILASSSVPDFYKDDFSDLAVCFFFHFAWGKLPSPTKLAAHLGPRTRDGGPRQGDHWSDFASRWELSKAKRLRDISLAEFCQRYEAVELWFDTHPNAQLQLTWLLDYFRSYPEIVARLKMRLVNRDMIGLSPEGFGKWLPPLVDVTKQELVTARAAWKAYRSSTPEACFNLLAKDLSALPLLRPVLIDLLAELPSASTGLGATGTRSPTRFSISGASARLGSSGSGRWATCWMALRLVRRLLLSGSMKSCAQSNEKIWGIVKRPTAAADFR